MKKKISQINISELYLGNEKHDKVLDNVLEKTGNTIEGLIENEGKSIECSKIEEYKSSLSTNSIKDIYINASLQMMQNNYQANIELLLNRKNTSFEEYKLEIDNAIKQGIHIGIKVFSVVMQKITSFEEANMLFQEFNNEIIFDQKLFELLSKLPLSKENIILLIDKYQNDNINSNTIVNIISKSDNIVEGKKVIQKYIEKENINILMINELIKLSNNYQDGIKILNKYNIEPDINTISCLLKISFGKNNIEQILSLLPANKYININTLSLLLFKIDKLSEIDNYSAFINIKSIDKRKFINNYHIKKLLIKFNIDSAEEMFNKIEKILNKEINEDNWAEFII